MREGREREGEGEIEREGERWREREREGERGRERERERERGGTFMAGGKVGGNTGGAGTAVWKGRVINTCIYMCTVVLLAVRYSIFIAHIYIYMVYMVLWYIYIYMVSGAYEGRSVQLRGTAFESERLRHFPFMDIFSSGA